jgi:hypothetical protein
MIRLQNILFLLVAVVLYFGTTETATSVDSKHGVQYSSVSNPQPSTIFPEKRPELFGLHRQGRSVVNLIRTLPVPNAKSNDQETAKSPLITEISIRLSISVYLIHSRDLDQSLTIKELLFPYHHFW